MHASRDVHGEIKKKLIEVEDKIIGSLGKSHEKIKCCETKMENQRHGQ